MGTPLRVMPPVRGLGEHQSPTAGNPPTALDSPQRPGFSAPLWFYSFLTNRRDAEGTEEESKSENSPKYSDAKM
ncbi:hypothetical protein [Nostoc sp.]|uniref:hypothetical protein n=1 Tax=Nostoc sp. TaxID=1180 RepID=UPI002FF59340